MPTNIVIVSGIMLILIYYFLYRYISSVKCPRCGHNKFRIVAVGSPQECKRCGWQNTIEWRAKNPYTKIKGKRWDVYRD